MPNFQNFLNYQNLLNCQQTGNVVGVVKIQFDGVGGEDRGRSQKSNLNQKEQTARDRPVRFAFEQGSATYSVSLGLSSFESILVNTQDLDS